MAVKDLSLNLAKGQALGLIGPNGAGKTTVFNLVSGNFEPDQGTITFDGLKISGKKSHAITRLGISRTFQTVRPFSKMSVLENVEVGALFGRDHSMSIKNARNEAEQILDFVSLREKARLLASSLTLAEQRRLELARAIATKPKVLMLDEVMAGLNQVEISGTLGLLEKLRNEKGITLLVIEHIMKAIFDLCDSIVVMDYGVKIAEGPPSDVMKDDAVIAAYMGPRRTRDRNTEAP